MKVSSSVVAKTKPRPIVAMLTKYKMNIALLQQGRELKNTQLSINELFPHELVEMTCPVAPFQKAPSREAECSSRGR